MPARDEPCVVCGGPPAIVYLAIPPARRVQKYGNGETIPFTLCQACQGATTAEIDAGLRRREEGGAHGA